MTIKKVTQKQEEGQGIKEGSREENKHLHSSFGRRVVLLNESGQITQILRSVYDDWFILSDGNVDLMEGKCKVGSPIKERSQILNLRQVHLMVHSFVISSLFRWNRDLNEKQEIRVRVRIIKKLMRKSLVLRNQLTFAILVSNSKTCSICDRVSASLPPNRTPTLIM